MPDPSEPMDITSTPYFPPAVQPSDVGRYPAGFRLRYTFYDPESGWESDFAPQAERLAPPSGGIGTVYYWLGDFETVHGEPGLRVYLSLQPWHGVGYWTPFQAIASYPAGFTSGGSSAPTAYELAPVDATVRLRHATGVVCWEHNGQTMRVRSGGEVVLETPLPALAATPPTLAGQDPASGLPAWCPAPVITTQPPAPAVDVPDPSVATSVRCGMAQAMATKLAGVYDQIATIVTWAVSTFVGYATTLLLNIVIDALTGPEASLFLVVADARLTLIVSSLVSEATRGALPQLDGAAEHALLQAAYCALSPVDGRVAVTADTLTVWSANVGAATSGFVGIEQWALGELVGLISLAAWQSAAYQGGQSPSAACEGMMCP